MEPHIPDKDKMIDELLRVLKPGGTLILAGWNVRDDAVVPLSPFEHKKVRPRAVCVRSGCSPKDENRRIWRGPFGSRGTVAKRGGTWQKKGCGAGRGF